MMELVLSKIWTVLFGVALISSMLFAFGSVEDRSLDQALQDTARGMESTISMMGSMAVGSSFDLDLSDLIPPPLQIELRQDHMIVQAPEDRQVTVYPGSTLTLMDDGKEVDSMILGKDDRIVIEVLGPSLCLVTWGGSDHSFQGLQEPFAFPSGVVDVE